MKNDRKQINNGAGIAFAHPRVVSDLGRHFCATYGVAVLEPF